MRMIVPFSAGAGTDLLSRMIARKPQESWGQSMIVENRPGGGTIIGVAAAAKAPPDGYTPVMVTLSFIINATGLKNLSYDSIKDFAPVTLFTTSPLLLVAHPWLSTARDRVPESSALTSAPRSRSGQKSPEKPASSSKRSDFRGAPR